MDAAAPATLRAARHRVASSSPAALARVLEIQSRSFWLGGDIFGAVELRSRRVMLFRLFQHVIVRRRLPFVIVRLAIIFSHWVIDKFVPHQNPTQIRMAIETNSVEIEDFTLL